MDEAVETSNNWYLRIPKTGWYPISPHTALELSSVIWIGRRKETFTRCDLRLHFAGVGSEQFGDADTHSGTSVGAESFPLCTEDIGTFSSEAEETGINQILEGQQTYIIQATLDSDSGGTGILLLGRYIADENTPKSELGVGSGQIGVEVVDDVVGLSGPFVSMGSIITLWYTAKVLDTGVIYERIDTSTGNPAVITMGSDDIISGWTAGLIGMRGGGKRTLRISPDQAFGSQGCPPLIPPNATIEIKCFLIGVAPQST